MKMEENPNNIVAVCSHCSEKLHKEWQKKNANLIVSKGDSIKASFTDSHGTEHLWITVTGIENQGKEKVYIGRITNIPVLLQRYRYGQRVKIGRHEIESYIQKT